MSTNFGDETIPVAARITKSMQKGIEQILETDGYLNTSDYVRDLIRSDLENRGLLQKAKTDQEAKK